LVNSEFKYLPSHSGKCAQSVAYVAKLAYSESASMNTLRRAVSGAAPRHERNPLGPFVNVATPRLQH
jgi:hypothetical protein